MITIYILNLLSPERNEHQLYNYLSEDEKKVFDADVLTNGKVKDYDIYTFAMPLSKKNMVTDFVKPFLDENFLIKEDAWDIVHYINGYEVQFIDKRVLPFKKANELIKSQVYPQLL